MGKAFITMSRERFVSRRDSVSFVLALSFLAGMIATTAVSIRACVTQKPTGISVSPVSFDASSCCGTACNLNVTWNGTWPVVADTTGDMPKYWVRFEVTQQALGSQTDIADGDTDWGNDGLIYRCTSINIKKTNAVWDTANLTVEGTPPTGGCYAGHWACGFPCKNAAGTPLQYKVTFWYGWGHPGTDGSPESEDSIDTQFAVSSCN